MKTILELAAPLDFSLRNSLFGHGWCELPPFHCAEDMSSVSRLLKLSSGKLVLATPQDSDGQITLAVEHQVKLSARDKTETARQMSDCLRLLEDYGPFFAVLSKHKTYAWAVKLKAGRLLRGPSLFEDVVKTLCTTNCNWGATAKMTGALARLLGEHYRGDYFTFPAAERIAGVTEKFLKDEIRMGYRAAYLLELAENVAGGKLNLESWKHSDEPTAQLYKKLRGIKGIGDYAAGNILKLLGRYDYLAIDSWCRMKFAKLKNKGQAADDKTIAGHYAKFKEWQGLFMWLDLTKDWYAEQLKA